MTTSAAPLSGFQTIIFDFDGVIMDSEPAANAALADALTHFGALLSAEECMLQFCGLRWSDCWPRIAQRLHQGISEIDFVTEISRSQERRLPLITPIAGVEAFIRRHSHRCLAIASSSDLDWINQHLARHALREHFEGRIYSSRDLPNGKPAPDVYLQACKELNEEPTRCLVIEDHPLGVRAAKAAGMKVVQLMAGAHMNYLPDVASEADLVVRSYGELQEQLT